MQKNPLRAFHMHHILLLIAAGILILAVSECGNSKQIKEIKPLQRAENPNGLKIEGEEIAYDDGTMDGQYSPWISESGSQLAVVFTPTFYPAFLTKVRFFIGIDGIPTTKFRVRVFGGTFADGPDESRDLLKSEVMASAAFGNKWVEVDLSGQNMVIQEGDFCVSMEWLTPPGEHGEKAQRLGVDNSDSDSRSWWKTDSNSDWKRIEGVANVGDRDIMIRATISKK